MCRTPRRLASNLLKHTILAIFIDANIPVYAGGSEHPLREPCLEVLRVAAARSDEFITDAEVLQEMLHRYLAIRRWAAGRAVFVRFAALMQGRTEPIYGTDVEMAASRADGRAGLQARDLLHLAVMMRVGCRQIVSADGGFDRMSECERL